MRNFGMKVFLLFILLITLQKLSSGQSICTLKIGDLEKRIFNSSDTLYVVNFWATWCAPCVKELPDFDSISKTYENSKVKVLLVTLDFKEDLQEKVLPFIKSKKIYSEVALLDEINGNYFIPKISEAWTGALPATLITSRNKKVYSFFEKKLTYLFLKNEIEKFSCTNTGK
jgi:thiol-disulfide isomerase/thioredoxin